MARSTGFVKRDRKFNGLALLSVAVFGGRTNYQVSLTAMCQHLHSLGVRISKQGLDQRLNSSAVKVLKTMLEELLELKLLDHTHTNHLLKSFSGIRIVDATGFQLPDGLQDHFRGFSGGAKKSGIKTHYVVDMITGAAMNLELTHAVSSDTTTTLVNPPKDTLQLFDLGYITMDLLKKIAANQAFYLCRARYNIKVWVKTGRGIQLLNWEKVIRKMKVGQIQELDVYLGKHKEVACRMIMEKVPAVVAAEKRRKLRTDKINKRNSLSAGRLAFCDLNVYITNAPVEKIAPQNIRAIYGIRWQIEIYFKTWKSYLNIDKVEKMNIHRFLCTHYGTLIYIILTCKLFFFFKYLSWKTYRVELSEMKAMKLMAAKKHTLWKLIFSSLPVARELLGELAHNLLHNCIKENKKFKLTPYQTIFSSLN